MKRLLILVSLAASLPVLATDYWVKEYTGGAAGGDDVACYGTVNDGRGVLGANVPYCAFGSIEHCVSVMVAGDTCHLNPHTYSPAAGFTKNTSCTVGLPCRIVGAGSTQTIVLADVAHSTAFWYFSNADNWTIEGLTLKSSSASSPPPLRMTGGDNIVLRDFKALVHPRVGWSDGIQIFGGSNALLTGVEARHEPVCQQTCGGPEACRYNTTALCFGGTRGGLSCSADADCTGGGTCDNRPCDFVCGGSAIVIDANDGATLEKSTFGYMRNATVIKNSYTVTARQNTCIDPANHACYGISDVDGLLIENNVLTRDVSSQCLSGGSVNLGGLGQDNAFAGSLTDGYCSQNVIIRNNTLVAHGRKMNTFIQTDACNPDNNSCAGTDSVYGAGPNLGCGTFRYWKIYNNIMYDNLMLGISCMGLPEFTGTPPYFTADGNVFSKCIGSKAVFKGGSLAPTGCADGSLGTGAGTVLDPKVCSFADWQARNVDGSGASEDPNGTSTWDDSYFVSYGSNNLRLSASRLGVNTGPLPCPTVDRDGVTRTGHCDVGAYHYGASVSPTLFLRGVTIKSGIAR
jgi:hypothetical protein